MPTRPCPSLLLAEGPQPSDSDRKEVINTAWDQVQEEHKGWTNIPWEHLVEAISANMSDRPSPQELSQELLEMNRLAQLDMSRSMQTDATALQLVNLMAQDGSMSVDDIKKEFGVIIQMRCLKDEHMILAKRFNQLFTTHYKRRERLRWGGSV